MFQECHTSAYNTSKYFHQLSIEKVHKNALSTTVQTYPTFIPHSLAPLLFSVKVLFIYVGKPMNNLFCIKKIFRGIICTCMTNTMNSSNQSIS